MTSESIVTALLESEGYAVFEYLGESGFRLIGDPPGFCVQVLGESAVRGTSIRLAEHMIFLESFLPDAEECWSSETEGRVNSGPWIEAAEGREIALEASAFRLAGKRMLLIRNPQKQYEEGTRVLQKARESALGHERLLREIQKKEILLHCVIHDLSQPLSAMRGCFSLLEAENLSPRNRGIIEIGQRQSQNQEELIRGILQAFSAELAAQEAVRLDPAGGPDLVKCAREIATDFSAAFATRDARIELAPEIDLTRNWQVRGDESRLRRIYTNLVENALRYSPPGSVVTLGVVAEGNYLRAYVDDEGPGLPTGASAARLFGLFAKGKEGGGKAGLGLYFCKITVERWGGAIGCQNRPCRGTRFWFRLPRAEGRSATDLEPADSREGSDSAARPSARHETKKHSRPLRLLLAEDSPVNRQITVLLLQKQGHNVVAVENGKEALARMETEAFEAVILDEEMPEMGGLETTRAIREKEKSTSARIPIVAITGNASESARRRFREAGVNAHLAKPFHEEDLIRTLEDLHRGVASIPSVSPAESMGAGSFDARELLARVGGNPRVLRDLARIFLEDTPKRMSAIRRAIAKKDGDSLARAAHALKGSVAMLGAKEVAEEARKIETMGRNGNVDAASEILASFVAKVSDFERLLAGLAARPGKSKTRIRIVGGARKQRRKR